MFAQVVNCPPTEYPTFPDIVPPGHAGDHLGNPQTDVIHAVSRVIGDCDAFILCGLSADPPDTEEIAGYLRHLKPGVPVFHIDRDQAKPAARLLKAATSRYFFVDPSELKNLPVSLYVALHRAS